MYKVIGKNIPIVAGAITAVAILATLVIIPRLSKPSLSPYPSRMLVSDPRGGVYPVNIVLVSLVPDATLEDAQKIATSVNGKVQGVLRSTNLYWLEVPARTIEELDAIMESIEKQKNPKIEGISKDYQLPEGI